MVKAPHWTSFSPRTRQLSPESIIVIKINKKTLETWAQVTRTLCLVILNIRLKVDKGCVPVSGGGQLCGEGRKMLFLSQISFSI